jgi:hypothetical protein
MSKYALDLLKWALSSSSDFDMLTMKMDDHLLACQPFLTESHIVTRLSNERAL